MLRLFRATRVFNFYRTAPYGKTADGFLYKSEKAINERVMGNYFPTKDLASAKQHPERLVEGLADAADNVELLRARIGEAVKEAKKEANDYYRKHHKVHDRRYFGIAAEKVTAAQAGADSVERKVKDLQATVDRLRQENFDLSRRERVAKNVCEQQMRLSEQAHTIT